jgi:hypothetical protein
MNINIGGGRKFLHRGWLNLDGQEGFPLTPECTFPIDEAEIVYSSHCLEHLDDATVDRVLSEARRVCKGLLVLKLPDFEEVLRRWKAGDEAYFNAWGMNGVVRTWASRGVPDSIDSRASMIFCGWWNAEYGDEWGKRSPEAPKAFHGPVMPMNAELAARSPHEISKALKDVLWMLPKRRGVHWNHQNAWSVEELHKLLSRHGFTIDSIDPDEICRMAIPTINDMRGISMYVSAR